MSADRFNRQFILLDFRDLDNPDYLAFVRAPEFSTYLLMRRYIWRSRQTHLMGLEAHYAAGLLACSLDRERISEQLGGVSTRTVSNDLAQLERRGVIQVQHTGRQNIYVLGRWGEDEGAYYETWYVDRLHVREEEIFSSEMLESFSSDGKKTSSINREQNREPKREEFENSKRSTLKKIGDDRGVIAGYIEDFAREFRDEAAPASSITRALNLYLSSELELDAFLETMLTARITTQRRTPAILKQSNQPGSVSTKNKMPYFFSVLASLLGAVDTYDISPRRLGGR